MRIAYGKAGEFLSERVRALEAEVSHSRRALATILTPDHQREGVFSTHAWVLENSGTGVSEGNNRGICAAVGIGKGGEENGTAYDDDEVQRSILRAHGFARSDSRDTSDFSFQV